MKMPLTLDSSTAIKLTMGGTLFQERSMLGRMDVWHKIQIVRGTHYDKDVALRAILHAAEPADLMPVKYQPCGEDTYFLVRNCGQAIENLCKSSLIIKNPEGNPLILLITLGFASVYDLNVNIQPLVSAALTRRYDSNKKLLNLEAFHEDSELVDIVYCPLSRPRAFIHLLKLAQTTLTNCEYLNLQRNDLSDLSAMEDADLIRVKYLDLRHNKLLNMDTLAPLKNMTITKIWLDNNPLCENYSNTTQYVMSAKLYCPRLIQIDGVYTDSADMPLICNSYFNDKKRENLVNQFINHFFTLYDQNDRSTLRGLYRKNSFYSLSFNIPFSLAQKKGLGQFTASRNVLKKSDPNKRSHNLYYGQDNILARLKKLPRSCHDRNSFLCDLMYDDGKCLIISVSGYFKNTSSTMSLVLSFNRTFVLMASLDNEYNILNDQYSVGPAPEYMSPNSIDSIIYCDDFTVECFSRTEKIELLDKFGNITRMTKDWCRTYMEETHWNLRKAITNFMKDYKRSSIPYDAFKK